MAATTGKKVRVKVSGVAVPFVADAMTNSGDSKTYTITNTGKRVWDPAVPILVYVNGFVQPATSGLYTINRLAGQVVFPVSQGANPITVSGSYLPMSTVADGKSFACSAKGITGEDTAFGDTDVTRQQLQRTCSGAIGQWWVNNAMHALFLAGAVLTVEIAIADGATPFFRAWALLTDRSHEVAAGGSQEEPLTWEGTADSDGRSFAFLL